MIPVVERFAVDAGGLGSLRWRRGLAYGQPDFAQIADGFDEHLRGIRK